jgi:DNA polymerase-3 subunit gamma/tau
MEKYQPLFLKYRPQSLSDLIGQDYVLRTLSNAITHDRICHAYLFTGPRGTGKTSSARILAKSLNCQNGPTVTPCQTCTSCIEITQGNSSAVLEIDAASNNSVDDARVLIERAPLVAPGGRFKLYIIDECHMLTKEAFNALLKTIEEPPPKVIFVLATTEEHKVPPTILSRCQRLIFRLVNQGAMSAYLRKIAAQEKINIEPDAVDLIARRSQGGLRDALALLDQASLLSSTDHPVSAQDIVLLVSSLNEDILFTLSQSVIDGDGPSTLSVINELISEGREPSLIAAELAKHILNLAKASCFSAAGLIGPEQVGRVISGSAKYIERLLECTQRADRNELTRMVEALDRLEQTCKRSSQPALNLEIGLLALCHRLNVVDLNSLGERLSRLEQAIGADPGLILQAPQPPPSKPPSVAKSTSKAAAKPVAQSTISQEEAKAPEDTKAFDRASVEKDIPRALAPGPSSPVESAKVDPTPALPASTSQPMEDDELNLLWGQLLEELQRRHIPTFSLVSTHGFPVSLLADELTIGVLLEQFQKMIENKVEYIQAAARVTLGKDLVVRIRTVDQSSKGGKASRARAKKVEDKSESLNEPVHEVLERKPEQNQAENTEPPAESKTGRPSRAEQPASSDSDHAASQLIQEAAKLFEGPGSRRISTSQ